MSLCEAFSVNVIWLMKEVPSSTPNRGPSTLVTVSHEIILHQSTWMESLIQSNTDAEMEKVYTLWQQCAMEHIQRCHLSSAITKSSSTSNIPLIDSNIISSEFYKHTKVNVCVDVEGGYSTDEFFDCEEYEGLVGDNINNDMLHEDSTQQHYYDQENNLEMSSSYIQSQIMHDIWAKQQLQTSNVNGNIISTNNIANFHKMRSTTSPYVCDDEEQDEDAENDTEPIIGTVEEGLNKIRGYQGSGRKKDRQRYQSAITIVEVLFVLTEASFWKVHVMLTPHHEAPLYNYL